MSPAHDLPPARQAIDIRDEWLARGLSTAPAEREAFETAVRGLYEMVGAGPPRFVWVDSPAAAVPVLAGLGTQVVPAGSLLRTSDLPPVASRLASLMTDLRGHLDGRLRRRPAGRLRPALAVPLESLPPEEALRHGVRPERLVEVTVADSLRTSLRDCVAAPLRTAFHKVRGQRHWLTWYGQHDAHWVARHDAWRRLGLLRLARQDARQLDLWAELARRGGWWWPGEGVCVVSERPAEVHWEPMPGGLHGQVRLHRDDGPAVRFRDGWGVHVLHGTHVPGWVIEDPAVERIHAEPNIEVRRSAIERIGWETYVSRAGLALVGAAPDPGNPGCELRLYDMPGARVLLAVNGSVERDGHRRRYGLTVPTDIDDPIEAAGWSYGLSGELYAQLVRRT
ncbi:DUF6745 domain-containing protein [Thermomonospora cellulosilytica]|uniref:DUF6745 domain-containing protein n=1 Tax=Thermomonospora cellulosilytica TaxID=1411118 RepID=A0A7W3MZM3_9ACTN|nr:hypothetical protein [Thermomonospora cellulosilytica]MBA9004825.1 hypothetical protein [Thermomonospora cellulosilytica]